MTVCPICGGSRAGQIDMGAGARPLFRCAGCGVVHWGALWGRDEAIEHYHDYYPASVQYDPVTERRYHALLDTFSRWTSPGPVLDVGCGAGHFLAVAESRGWTATGLEVSTSGLELLERIRAERGYRFTVVGTDLRDATWAPETFRVITLFEVLEHLADPVGTLKAAYRLLEPNGLLYLTTPNFDSVSRYALRGQWRIVTPEHLLLFNPRTMRDCLRRAGFEPVTVATKNIDIPEIALKWRRATGPGNGSPPVKTWSATTAMRGRVEQSASLRAAKRCVNLALRLTGLGETIEVLARRPA